MSDYIAKCQEEADSEKVSHSGLCCCEYIDHENKRYNIIACCCNCDDFDQVGTDWITCRPIDRSRLRNMLLTFQDRLRIPWQGGAKQITLSSLIPIFVIPLLIGLAAINVYTCIIIFLSFTVIMGYALNYVQRRSVRTSFFFVWISASLIYSILLFQMTIPLFEVLPEENLALVILSLISLFCFYKTHRRASLNNVVQSVGNQNDMADITEASLTEENATDQTALLIEDNLEESQSPEDVSSNLSNICSTCRKCVPLRTAHCSVCRACIRRHDHHSYWLNCCIGESNHRYYIAGLFFAFLALLLGADLTLTAICHPFLLAYILGLQILLPDDCSEVFDIYE
ncbi:unnamed protein product [Ceratitis capitata]|nr:unnamed protein product [Ceratitis capitata]